jgi:hypothetical protein
MFKNSNLRASRSKSSRDSKDNNFLTGTEVSHVNLVGWSSFVEVNSRNFVSNLKDEVIFRDISHYPI